MRTASGSRHNSRALGANCSATDDVDGPLAKESPSSPADLRILCSGQFLDNSKTLKGDKQLY